MASETILLIIACNWVSVGKVFILYHGYIAALFYCCWKRILEHQIKNW